MTAYTDLRQQMNGQAPPRLLPNAVTAEHGLLGAVLRDNRLFAPSRLSPEHFFQAAYGRIWAAMRSLIGDGRVADVATLAPLLQQDADLQARRRRKMSHRTCR
jgi:replicative DNA helicase